MAAPTLAPSFPWHDMQTDALALPASMSAALTGPTMPARANAPITGNTNFILFLLVYGARCRGHRPQTFRAMRLRLYKSCTTTQVRSERDHKIARAGGRRKLADGRCLVN